MIAPESPLHRDSLPGLRNMPLVIRQKSEAFDIHEEKEINKKWFKHFFDDLGAVAEYESYKNKEKAKYTNQYKLMKQKTKFVRGQPKKPS